MEGYYDIYPSIVVYAEALGYPAIAVLGCFLLSFLVQIMMGKRLGSTGKYISLGLSLTATLIAVLMAVNFDNWNDSGLLLPFSSQVRFLWFSVDNLWVQAGILVDGVSVVMLALVSFITFLVHWFSLEYMKDDPRLPRYWALLGLFAFSMCGVVLADNLFLIFVFWELVGFCSYLLIGFWFHKPASGPASQKAFIINRIGDLGFIIALMLMFANGLDFGLEEAGRAIGTTVYSPLSSLEGPDTTWIGFFLLLGVMGKSAQFPLQVWLPDAMAGPTPVSSLLHAATMVAAGVYLLIRTGFLFTPPILEAMSWIGGLTALMAAISALTQNDIKGVLAYSTISQLGFMVMAVGVGASFYAYFHLITHAFFKCGLFLAAGAVIHQLHAAQHEQGGGQHSDEPTDGHHFDAQDIRLMGGLARKMPLTMGTYLVFAAALAGLPLFSGFFSKDGILMGAIENGIVEGGMAWGPAIFGLIASLLTAFYITRHGLLIFFGKQRTPENARNNIRPASWTMRIPLLLLAIGSLGLIKFLLAPIFKTRAFRELSHSDHSDLPEIILMGLFVLLALIGIGIAFWMWRSGKPGGSKGVDQLEGGIRTGEQDQNVPQGQQNRAGALYNLSKEHFFLDRAYEKGIARSFLRFSNFLGWFDKEIVDGAVNRVSNLIVNSDSSSFSLSWLLGAFDRKVIDGIVNQVAASVLAFGKRFRKLQGGNLQRYLLYALIGLLLLLGALIYFA